MGSCEFCGDYDRLLRECKYCGHEYCSEHTLPENHNCPGLRNATKLGPSVYDESNADDVMLGDPETERGDDTDEPDGTDPERGASSETTPNRGQARKTNKTAYSEGKRSGSPDASMPRHKQPDYESSPDVTTRSSTETNTSNNRSDAGRITKAFIGYSAGKHYEGDCPVCGRWVTKYGTERFAKCNRCGWKAGLPGLRLLTHWPNWVRRKRQATRWTKRLLAVLLIGLAGLLVLGATVGTGIAVVDDATSGLRGEVGGGGTLSGFSADLNPSTDGLAANDGVNETLVEQKVHQLVNQRRAKHGLSQLEYDRELAAIADGHSEDMARNGYFSHTGPGGATMEDRYEQAAYTCQVPIDDNRYATGGENIAQTYYQKEMTTDRGARYYESESELAKGIVAQWMNSTGHRENILRSYWRQEGIGIAVTEGGKVYATQNFC